MDVSFLHDRHTAIGQCLGIFSDKSCAFRIKSARLCWDIDYEITLTFDLRLTDQESSGLMSSRKSGPTSDFGR